MNFDSVRTSRCPSFVIGKILNEDVILHPDSSVACVSWVSRLVFAREKELNRSNRCLGPDRGFRCRLRRV